MATMVQEQNMTKSDQSEIFSGYYVLTAEEWFFLCSRVAKQGWGKAHSFIGTFPTM